MGCDFGASMMTTTYADPKSSDRLLTGWGRTAPSRARVLGPMPVERLQELVAAGPAPGLLARGAGRSYGDAAQNAGGIVLAPATEPGITIDTAAATVRAAGSVTFTELLTQLVPQGLLLPVLPGTRHVTVGGAIAADVHGKNQRHVGSIAAWIDEIELLDGTGEIQTLTPDGTPGAFRATVGGMGLTGIILSATTPPAAGAQRADPGHRAPPGQPRRAAQRDGRGPGPVRGRLGRHHGVPAGPSAAASWTPATTWPSRTRLRRLAWLTSQAIRGAPRDAGLPVQQLVRARLQHAVVPQGPAGGERASRTCPRSSTGWTRSVTGTGLLGRHGLRAVPVRGPGGGARRHRGGTDGSAAAALRPVPRHAEAVRLSRRRPAVLPAARLVHGDRHARAAIRGSARCWTSWTSG